LHDALPNFISNPKTPPSSGSDSLKKPNNTERTTIANKSQNHVFLSFADGSSNAKQIPVRANSRTKRNEAAPKPLYKKASAKKAPNFPSQFCAFCSLSVKSVKMLWS